MDQGQRLQQWAALSRDERQREIQDAFDVLARDESAEAFREVQFRVSAEGYARVRELADSSVEALEQGRITDAEVAAKMATGDARENFTAVWGAPFERLMQAVLQADLDGDELALRLWVVYVRLSEFVELLLERQGWTDDFGPLVGLIEEAQSRLAIETPAGRTLPNPSLGEILERAKNRG